MCCFQTSLQKTLRPLVTPSKKDELTEKQKSNKPSWTRAEEAFIDADDNHGELQLTDDGHSKGGAGIDPPNIQPHNWKKLPAICKDIQKQWKVAHIDCEESGTHHSDFHGFCDGCEDIHHLFLSLQMRPQLDESVTALLPDSRSIESAEPMPGLQTTKVRTSGKRAKRDSAIDQFASQLNTVFGG